MNEKHKSDEDIITKYSGSAGSTSPSIPIDLDAPVDEQIYHDLSTTDNQMRSEQQAYIEEKRSIELHTGDIPADTLKLIRSKSTIYYDTLLRSVISLQDTRDLKETSSVEKPPDNTVDTRILHHNVGLLPAEVSHRLSHEPLKEFKYNPKYNYAAEVERPTLRQKQLTFIEDRLWYQLVRLVLYAFIIILSMFQHDAKFLATFEVFWFLYLIYAIDLFMSILMHQILKFSVTEPNPVAKPLWICFIELVAIIPIEYIPSIYVSPEMPWYLRAKSGLLIIRVLYEYVVGMGLLETTVMTRIWYVLMSTICLRLFIGSIIFAVVLQRTSANFLDVFDLKTTLEYFIKHIGISRFESHSPIIIFSFVIQILIYLPAICLITFTYTLNNSVKYSFNSHVKLFERVLIPRFNIPKENADVVMNYMNVSWRTRANYMFLQSAIDEQICCQTTYEAMRYDRNLQALQHCPMLRDFESYVLRYLAQFVTPKFYLKGKYLYKFPMKKLAMYYIAAGVVDILSSEDGQSEIIKLTAGTCVGTMCLIRPYRTCSNFRTSTECEVYEFKAKDFTEFARNFPREYRACLTFLQTKIDQAVLLRSIKLSIKPNAVNNNIIWLKRELHRFMSMKSLNPKDHYVTNIYLMKTLNCNDIEDVLYTKMNLDVLCIQPRSTRYHQDSVFLKPTCLWIFHPNSPVRYFLDKIMFVVALVTYLVFVTAVAQDWDIIYMTLTHTLAFVFYLLQILLLSMTPIHLDGTRKIWKVFALRMREPTFVADVFTLLFSALANLYMNLKIPIFIPFLAAGVRLWRVLWLYWHIENNEHTNIFAKQFLFYIGMYTFIWYNAGLLINRVDLSSTDKQMVFTFKAIMFTIGQGLDDDNISVSMYYFSVPNSILQLLYIIVTALMASSYFLIKTDYIATAGSLAATERYITSTAIQQSNVSLTLRLESFLNTMINDFQYLRIQTHNQRFMRYPQNIRMIIKPDKLLKYMGRSQFFTKFPKDLIQELVSCSTVEMYCERAIVIARTVRYHNIYILIDGQMCSVERDQVRPVEKGADLNVIEIIMGMPAVRNFVALSHVLIGAVPYDSFLQLLTRYSHTNKVFLKTVESIKMKCAEDLMNILHGKPMVIIEVDRRLHRISFYSHKCVMYRDSYEAYDFFTTFDRLGVFSCVRFVLLRVTFHPEGRFFMTWERFRVGCTCLSTIAFLLPASFAIHIPGLNEICTAFDVVSFIDIYLRFHVCYYNSMGVLITHPLCTAKFYLSRAFITDFISNLPIEFYSSFTIFRTVIRALRIIQLYRVYGYCQYSMNKSYLYTLIRIVYVTVVMVVALSTFFFEWDCTGSTMTKRQCQSLDANNPIQSYLSVLWIMTCAATGTYMKLNIGIAQFNTWTRVCISFTCLLGIFWRALCLATTFTSFTIVNSNISARTDIRKLINFMKFNKLPKILREHVLEYFYVHWKWHDVYQSDTVIQNMNTSLQRNTLFHLFGDPCIRFNSFTSDYRNITDFYKNVFQLSACKICPTLGRFITKNDVAGSIYFVYRGAVEITTPDGRILATLLAGGIFGNLTSKKPTRQRINAIARCNTQCLYISAELFHETLGFFPKIQAHFERATSKNQWFIKSKAKTIIPHGILLKHQRRKFKILQFILSVHMFLVCYIGTLLNCYQIAVGEDHIWFMVLLYSLDGLHYISMFLKIFSPRQNEFGQWCTSPVEIAQILATKSALMMGFLTTLPIDLPVFLMPSFRNKTYWLSGLRINRLLLIYYPLKSYLFLLNSSMSAWCLWRKCAIICYEVIYVTFLIATFYTIADPICTARVYKSHVLVKHDLNEILHLRDLNSVKKRDYFIEYLSFAMMITAQQADRTVRINPPYMEILTSIAFMLAFIMNLLYLCQFYDVIQDIYSRTSYIGTIMFNNNLKKSRVYSKHIRQRIVTNTRFVFSKDHHRNMHALQRQNTPAYLREVILSSAYGYFLTRHPIFKYCHIDFLRQVGAHFKVVDIPRGFEVMHKYGHRKCMFFILCGSVVMLQQDGDILDNFKYVLSPGDCFCFQLGLNQQKYAEYTYTCRVSSTILELEYQSWKDLIAYFPSTGAILGTVGEKYKDEPFLSTSLPIKMAKRYKMKNVLKRKTTKTKNINEGTKTRKRIY